MKSKFSEISTTINNQVDLASQNDGYVNIYTLDYAYVDASNASNDDRLKFKVDIESGTVTVGTLNSVHGEEISVPLASISGNYYSNLRNIKTLLNNPQRTFLSGLRYIERSEESKQSHGFYDVIIPSYVYFLSWN